MFHLSWQQHCEAGNSMTTLAKEETGLREVKWQHTAHRKKFSDRSPSCPQLGASTRPHSYKSSYLNFTAFSLNERQIKHMNYITFFGSWIFFIFYPTVCNIQLQLSPLSKTTYGWYLIIEYSWFLLPSLYTSHILWLIHRFYSPNVTAIIILSYYH